MKSIVSSISENEDYRSDTSDLNIYTFYFLLLNFVLVFILKLRFNSKKLQFIR